MIPQDMPAGAVWVSGQVYTSQDTVKQHMMMGGTMGVAYWLSDVTMSLHIKQAQSDTSLL